MSSLMNLLNLFMNIYVFQRRGHRPAHCVKHTIYKATKLAFDCTKGNKILPLVVFNHFPCVYVYSSDVLSVLL